MDQGHKGHPAVVQAIKALPALPGVYLFLNEQGVVLYIGKAKNLKTRVNNYVTTFAYELKSQLILTESYSLDFIVTANELEALLVEAKLIKNYQPRYNVLLKTGQPFLYLTITQGELPTLEVVRSRKKRGVYFGPFLEKTAARRVYHFLLRTFRLRICGKKIAGGCLNYHLGLCAGSCRQDFDREAYLQRLELAREVLDKGHKKFLRALQEQIAASNAALNFEKSRELHGYYKAIATIFQALDTTMLIRNDVESKDVWLLSEDQRELFVYQERGGVFKKRYSFIVALADEKIDVLERVKEFFLGFYRAYTPSVVIVVNVDFGDDCALYAELLTQLHTMQVPVVIYYPHDGYYAGIIRVGLIHLQQERERRKTLADQLKKFFIADKPIHSIDCFDISHKQGLYMVGSCVRFTDGLPDQNKFRRFKIKTQATQNDYASLHEIVARRYHDGSDLPDLILIDGGKGQLNSVRGLVPGVALASIAKREETIFSPKFPDGRVLDQSLYVSKVLIALRDYTHHFAISYHRLLELASLNDTGT